MSFSNNFNYSMKLELGLILFLLVLTYSKASVNGNLYFQIMKAITILALLLTPAN